MPLLLFSFSFFLFHFYSGVRDTSIVSIVSNTSIVTSVSSVSSVKPGFHMSGKSQTVWDFTVSRPSQILLTNENSKS